MRNLLKTLIAGTAIAILPLAAYAGGTDGYGAASPSSDSARILNGQINTANVWGNLNFEVQKVQNDVVLQGGAVGNAIQIMTMNDTYVQNNQMQTATVASQLNANINLVGGSVGIQNQSVCNTADVSTDPQITQIKSKQECYGSDPSSLVNATVQNVVGNVSISGSALANNFSADSNAPNMPVVNQQINTAMTASTVNARVANIAGSVGVSSVATGNNAQIIHYSTDQ